MSINDLPIAFFVSLIIAIIVIPIWISTVQKTTDNTYGDDTCDATGIMVEGDRGTLRYQGKKFISFERDR